MPSLKYWLCLGCLLMYLSSLSAATLEEATWRAAYEGELHCDPIATHNALVRLKNYERFSLISLTKEQKQLVEKSLARLILPKAVAPVTVQGVEVIVAAPTKSSETKGQRKRAPFSSGRSKKSIVNKDRVEADLLKNAESAYQFGRLEEAQRFYQLALKLKPTSAEAKNGLEKIAAEMK